MGYGPDPSLGTTREQKLDRQPDGGSHWPGIMRPRLQSKVSDPWSCPRKDLGHRVGFQVAPASRSAASEQKLDRQPDGGSYWPGIMRSRLQSKVSDPRSCPRKDLGHRVGFQVAPASRS